MCILCVQIHNGTSQSNTHRDTQSTLHVSFHYLLNYIEYITQITNTIFIYFKLKTEWLREKILQQDRIKAIQETIAGFLHDQVINPNGEFHFNGNETFIPNNDDNLYRLQRFGEENSMQLQNS